MAGAHTGIVVLDRDLRYRVFNQYMEELSGLHAREVIGRTPWDVSSELAAQGLEADVRRALAGEVVPHTKRFTRRDGRVTWSAGALAPLRGEQGEITGVIAVVQDISERVRIEEELRATRESLHSLMDNLPDAAMVVRDGRVVYANQRLADLIGYQRAADLVGRSAWELAASEDQTMVRERAAAVIDGAGTRAVREVRLVRRDGTKIPAEGTGTAVIYQGERSVLNVLRDVSERKALQGQLMTADRMASMGLLAAGVTHEINNPLASVIGNLQLLEEELRCLPVPSSALEMIGGATEAAGRVRDIVRDLKLFSGSHEGEEKHTLDLRTVIEAALRMAKNDIRHRARVVKEYGPAPPVCAQEWRLVQVFLNLLINAAQSIPAGGVERNEIRVRTGADEAGGAVVEISDTGQGIPPEILGRIFDPFFTTKQKNDGTGLGLAICDRLVRGLGGTIDAQSIPDQGSRFRVVLPAAPAGAAAEESLRRPEPASAPAPRVRVLIVDDDRQVGETVRRALAAQHDTLLVESGREALAYVRGGEQFDVILCDVMMPEMTGMALHAELVRVAPQQAERLIFVTGGAFTEDARRYLDRVPNLQVQKPFDLGELRSLVAGCAPR
jgi:PAS domain S-box-containing protein